MKNTVKQLDFKSVLIGILSTVLVFVLVEDYSASVLAEEKSTPENLGDIVVDSIRIVDGDGKTVAALGNDEKGGGLVINNNNGKTVAALGNDEKGGGLIFLNNDGEAIARLPE